MDYNSLYYKLIHKTGNGFYGGKFDSTQPDGEGKYIVARKSCRYLRKGRMHREDGPAYIERRADWYGRSRDIPIDVETVENECGLKIWYRNGKRHRVGSPAYIDNDSRIVAWYKNGKLHRSDGPAIIYAGGTEYEKSEWFINGHPPTKEELINIERMLKLKEL